MNIKEIPNFKIWYYDYADNVVSYDYYNKVFEVLLRPVNGCNSFYLPSNFQLKKKELKNTNHTEKSYDEYLREKCREYANLLIEWRDEFYKYKKLKMKFDYFDNSFKLKEHNNEIYYRTHTRNIKTFFKRLCKKDNKYIYEDYDPVYYDEYYWFNMCKNGGLMYLRNPGKYKNCFGCDFKMSYPTDMSSIKFQMPIKKGEAKLLNKLPDEYKYISFGVYRVKIECDNPDFLIVFTPNSNNYYTSYSLKFAFQLQKKFNIKIHLIQDGKPNAYIYKKEDLVSGNKIFANWYYRLKEMKEDMPKNGLVKLLSSSGWGHMNELQTTFKTEEELIEMTNKNIKIGGEGVKNLDFMIKNITVKETTIYELVDMKKPVYELPLRLLCFLTSFSRVKMGSLINTHNLYDKVLRIQTDSITFNQPVDIDIKGFIFDEKISGDIEFTNLNDYKEFTE